MESNIDVVKRVVSESFMTANSDGEGGYSLNIKTGTINEMHALHMAVAGIAQERHAKHTDSTDNYTDVMESPAGMVHMKPDSEPYMPKVGEVCEARWLELPDGGTPEWTNIKYKGGYSDQHWVKSHIDVIANENSIEFRPLKTERDKKHEECMKIVSAAMNGSPKGQDWGQHSRTISALIDADLIK